MAGFVRFFVVGGEGGFMGSDGVNPIEALILVGESDRQWLEPHYFDGSIGPIGKLKVIVPSRPRQEDAIVDALIGFCPHYFQDCPSFPRVAAELGNLERLDFDLERDNIPYSWGALREEVRPRLVDIPVWEANLERVCFS